MELCFMHCVWEWMLHAGYIDADTAHETQMEALTYFYVSPWKRNDLAIPSRLNTCDFALLGCAEAMLGKPRTLKQKSRNRENGAQYAAFVEKLPTCLWEIS
ncbi:hypothetical protein Taro_029348 [Colocasia esculenta]|uniref:Uncharacterized protein n=1 Tax=Colocasia esculenta TaxID=4460 RepID=A0A843VWX6_COLES|nr:hypothetical protein [Colocasia esculenta]